MKTRLIIAGLGNLIDTIATLYFVEQGFTEINRIMLRLLPYPWLFATVKMGLLTGVLLFLWKNREDKDALPLATFAAVVFGGIALYYAVWFAALLF